MDFVSEITRIVGEENVHLNEKMSGHTTFRVGGPAAYLVQPSDGKQIAELIRIAKTAGIEYYIVGNGSNLLVSDEGFDGMIVLIGRNMSDISVDGEIITAGAGAALPAIGMAAYKNSLTGFEFASGIPGTLGGACVMNAGAYGSEMKDVLLQVYAVDEDGNERVFSVEEMSLGYRSSIFIDGGYVVTGAVIRLRKSNKEDVNELMTELFARRKDKQPLDYPSAGSTFKRPEGYFAGKLIEDAGLKGKGAGGACVSEKHAGFVVNKGTATAKDIYDTIQLVVETVRDTTGIELEPEVRLIGNFK